MSLNLKKEKINILKKINIMKYIIIPDLHGEYDKLIFLLKQYVNIIDDKIQDNDYKIIQLGDIIDKGNIKNQIKLLTFI